MNAARTKFAVLAVAAVLLAAVAGKTGTDWVGERYRVGIDPQKYLCLPWRAYLVDLTNQERYARGDLVQFRAEGLEPYFKDGTLIHKYIAGVPGDRVVIADDAAYVNGEFWGHLWLHKKLKKEGRGFDRAFTVPDGRYFMLATTAHSYDGRYWGVIREDQVLAHVSPLW